MADSLFHPNSISKSISSAQLMVKTAAANNKTAMERYKKFGNANTDKSLKEAHELLVSAYKSLEQAGKIIAAGNLTPIEEKYRRRKGIEFDNRAIEAARATWQSMFSTKIYAGYKVEKSIASLARVADRSAIVNSRFNQGILEGRARIGKQIVNFNVAIDNVRDDCEAYKEKLAYAVYLNNGGRRSFDKVIESIVSIKK